MWFTAESRHCLCRLLWPQFDCLIYKAVFSDVCSLLSGPKFTIVIIPAQVAWSLCLSPYPFYDVFSEQGVHARYLPTLRQSFPSRIFRTICTLGRLLFSTVYRVQLTFPVQSQHETPYSKIGRTSDMYAKLFVILYTHYVMKCLAGCLCCLTF